MFLVCLVEFFVLKPFVFVQLDLLMVLNNPKIQAFLYFVKLWVLKKYNFEIFIKDIKFVSPEKLINCKNFTVQGCAYGFNLYQSIENGGNCASKLFFFFFGC